MIKNKKITSAVLAGLLSMNFADSSVIANADDNLEVYTQDSVMEAIDNSETNIIDDEMENVTNNVESKLTEDEESDVTKISEDDGNNKLEDTNEDLNKETESIQDVKEQNGTAIITEEEIGESEVIWSEDTDNMYSINDIVFSLNEDDGTASVYEALEDLSGDITLPSKIKVNGRYYMVTSIKSRAFSNCNNLTSVTIQNGLISIGEGAFYNCKNLGAVIIPDSVKVIEKHAFSGCKQLSYVSLSSSIADIEDGTFYDCSNLSNLIIPDGVKYIGKYAFAYCNLNSIMIPKGVTTLDTGAFYNCNNLNTIVFPDSITNVGSCAFLGCRLTSVWASGNKYDEFKNDFLITTCPVLINSNLYNRTSGEDNFIEVQADYVEGFEKRSDGTIKQIDMKQQDDNYKFYVHDLSTDEGGVKYYYYKAVINNITYESPLIRVVVNNAFDENNKCIIDGIEYTLNHDNYVTVSGITEQIENVEIPSKVIIGNEEYLVTSIGDLAFAGCENLKTTSISSDNMYYIGCRAFYDCTNLTSITIPKSVTAIGDNAFSGCNMNNLTFIIEDESSKDVLLEAGIVSDNIVVEE